MNFIHLKKKQLNLIHNRNLETIHEYAHKMHENFFSAGGNSSIFHARKTERSELKVKR